MTLLGTTVRAQGPAVPPKKVYTRKMQFHLPIQLDSKDRDTLDKIQLWVKDGPSGAWAIKASVAPAQTVFPYRVDHDGEYWFSVVTVDKTGASRPADVTHEPPGLMVVVDTRPPEVDVRAITLTDGSSALRCAIKDANPDTATLRVEYKSEGGVWHVLQPMADMQDMFHVPERALRGSVRVTASDLAKNSTTREVNPWSNRPVSAPALETVSGPALFETQSAKPVAPTAMPVGQTTIAQVAAHTPVYNPSASQSPTATPSGRSVQVINSGHASLEYQIDEVGPSGVGRVEVWYTKDEGQTWQKLCDDPDRRSPADIELPGDGLYGVSLVVSNGNGVSGTLPSRGDRPNWWIEVDTTKPQASLLDVHATSEDPSVFLITWEASDKNMKPDGIDLYYSTQRGGTWMPIARGLPNNGHYRWSVPRHAGAEFYVRLDVSDRAGNMARCEAKQPVFLDLQHPKARVVGVNVSAGGTYTRN